jgi:hypothetical protein
MSADIAVVENHQPPTLLHETNPVLILEESKAIANALADIIKEKKLYTNINGKDYVHVEGWTTLGALVKVFPILDWSKRLDREDEVIYESRVIAQTLKGEIIGIGEGLASGKEKTKSGSPKWTDEYAIKSMSITRATSKALRIPLGWIMTLAGYEGTPFEEMPPHLQDKNNRKPAPSGPKPAGAKKPRPAPAQSDKPPAGINPDTVQDAEVTPKTEDMTNGDRVNLLELKGINKDFDQWIEMYKDSGPTTIKQVCDACQDFLSDQKMKPAEFREVKKKMGMKVK